MASSELIFTSGLPHQKDWKPFLPGRMKPRREELNSQSGRFVSERPVAGWKAVQFLGTVFNNVIHATLHLALGCCNEGDFTGQPRQGPVETEWFADTTHWRKPRGTAHGNKALLPAGPKAGD